MIIFISTVISIAMIIRRLSVLLLGRVQPEDFLPGSVWAAKSGSGSLVSHARFRSANTSTSNISSNRLIVIVVIRVIIAIVIMVI